MDIQRRGSSAPVSPWNVLVRTCAGVRVLPGESAGKPPFCWLLAAVTFAGSAPILGGMNAIELWKGFREGRSEAAFGELVGRYTSLVFSVARRRLSDSDLAKDATQQVFIRLARARPNLRIDAELVAWLHRTTLHVSIDLWRTETRRRNREQKAFAMPTSNDATVPWSELAPELDEALDALSDADRQAVLLRFFERMSMRELGEAVGVSEDAAKMRVSRALERLRGLLGERGLACSVAVLGTLLEQHAVEAAPSGVVKGLEASAIAGAAVPLGSPTVGGVVLSSLKAKLFLGIAGIVGIVGLGILVARWNGFFGRIPVSTPSPQGMALAVSTPASAGDSTVTATSTGGKGLSSEGEEPKPLELLQAVAAARLAIPSGALKADFATENARDGKRWTNRNSVEVVFAGAQRRFDSRGTEYAYRYSPDEAEQDRIRRQADALTQEAATAVGLLSAFEARVVSIHDGTLLMSHRENDGRSEGATLEDPSRGSTYHNFDPRTLGLSVNISTEGSVEGCLMLTHAKEVRLIGREYLDGAPSWRVRVSNATGDEVDFWMDAARPERVLKVASRGQEAVSTYDDAPPGDPIPRVVVATQHAPTYEYRSRVRLSDVQYGAPVDAKTFTLAGLSMAVGTPVVDVRVHRQVGYWTGKGLSEDLPHPESKAEGTTDETDSEDWAEILETSPRSEAGRKAATAILLNTPDGPLVERAGSVILEHHIHVPDLSDLCDGLMRMRHRCSVPLLEAMVAKNPHRDVRAWALFVRATFHLDAAQNGENRAETEAAIKAFERVATEFSDVAWRGNRLSNLVTGPLRGLKFMSLGKPAPPIEGVSIDGEPVRLANHWGKVVVVLFWSRHDASRLSEYRSALASLSSDRIEFLGVYCDHDKAVAREAAKQAGITFPSVWDDRHGLIAKAWNVDSWVTTYVVDPEGILRGRDLRGRELLLRVTAILKQK